MDFSRNGDWSSDRDAENGDAEIASTKSIQALQAEISALRTEIQALTRQDLNR